MELDLFGKFMIFRHSDLCKKRRKTVSYTHNPQGFPQKKRQKARKISDLRELFNKVFHSLWETVAPYSIYEFIGNCYRIKSDIGNISLQKFVISLRANHCGVVSAKGKGGKIERAALLITKLSDRPSYVGVCTDSSRQNECRGIKIVNCV